MLQSFLLPLLAVAAGFAAALIFILVYTRNQRRSATGILSVARQEADRVRADGQRDAESTKSDLLLTAKMETLKLREELDREIQRRREEWERLERRVDERGRLQERKLEEIETREQKTAQREETLNQREVSLKTREGEADRLAQEQRVKLERIAGLTAEDARKEILQRVEDEARGQAAALVRDIKEQARRTADRDAKRIISMAIQR
ncbi:MAG TPA: Rnase Y domain-containing protein, partial [Gemmatimonadales bacterium]